MITYRYIYYMHIDSVVLEPVPIRPQLDEGSGLGG